MKAHLKTVQKLSTFKDLKNMPSGRKRSKLKKRDNFEHVAKFVALQKLFQQVNKQVYRLLKTVL